MGLYDICTIILHKLLLIVAIEISVISNQDTFRSVYRYLCIKVHRFAQAPIGVRTY